MFEDQFDYVCASLYRLGARGQDIEDIAHDVFLVFAQKADSLDMSMPLRPWLFGVCYRILCNFKRKARSAPAERISTSDLVASSPSPLESMIAGQQRAWVANALEQLPEEQRAVFVMHAIDDVKMPIVAEVLSIPLDTAYSRYRLAKEKFTKSLQRLMQGEHK